MTITTTVMMNTVTKYWYNWFTLSPHSNDCDVMKHSQNLLHS